MSSTKFTYVLRLADNPLILGQRLSEWCGHAPVLEEDIALANIALDLIGQSRALLSCAGRLEGCGHDEDQLAFLRDERDYRNATIVELPNGPSRPGDFAFTVLRNAMMATWFRLLWERLRESTDAELAAIAGKAVKEAGPSMPVEVTGLDDVPEAGWRFQVLRDKELAKKVATERTHRLRSEDEALLVEMEKKLSGKLSFRSDPTFHFEQFKITDAVSGQELG